MPISPKWFFIMGTADVSGNGMGAENTGVHISEQDLPRLFDAFYRVDSSRNRKNGGSGLGLYIVREILERHGADYEIRNTDAGVCFQMKIKKV